MHEGADLRHVHGITCVRPEALGEAFDGRELVGEMRARGRGYGAARHVCRAAVLCSPRSSFRRVSVSTCFALSTLLVVAAELNGVARDAAVEARGADARRDGDEERGGGEEDEGGGRVDTEQDDEDDGGAGEVRVVCVHRREHTHYAETRGKVYTTRADNACMRADLRAYAGGERRAVLRDVTRARGDAAERAALGWGPVRGDAGGRVRDVVQDGRAAEAPAAARAARVGAAAQPERVRRTLRAFNLVRRLGWSRRRSRSV